MTAPVTPYAALPYVAEGEPMYLMRQRLQDLVDRLDLVLQGVAPTPPGTADLAAVAARVGALESDQSAEDALTTRQAVTFGTGFSQANISGFNELVRVWKLDPVTVRCSGFVRVDTAVTAGSRPTVLQVPAGYRPVTPVSRSCVYRPAAATTAPTTFGIDARTDGWLELWAWTALASATWLSLDLTWRTTNP